MWVPTAAASLQSFCSKIIPILTELRIRNEDILGLVGSYIILSITFEYNLVIVRGSKPPRKLSVIFNNNPRYHTHSGGATGGGGGRGHSFSLSAQRSVMAMMIIPLPIMIICRNFFLSPTFSGLAQNLWARAAIVRHFAPLSKHPGAAPAYTFLYNTLLFFLFFFKYS